MRALTLIVAIVLSLIGSAATRADQLTIYRCTDAKGKQTLRDSPCKRGEKQQTQEMIRPRDAKPMATRAPEQPTARPVETVRYVMQPAPRPLYACITPDGQRYLSETAEGQSRWMPGWAADPYPYSYPYPPVTIARIGGDLRWRNRNSAVRIGGERQYIAGAPVIGAPVPPIYPAPVVAVGGYWARDACSALSSAETCEVLSDRRHEIRVRYSQAMPSERKLLDSESATLDTRLRQECGT